MNIKDYISSGILEAYSLGEITALERAEVEKVLAEYPEAREELARIEKVVETFAMKAAVSPRPEVKEKLMSRLSSATSAPLAKTVTMDSGSAISFWRYAVAASVAVALITSFLAYDYRSRWLKTEIAFNELSARNRQVAEDYNVVNQKLDKLQNDLAVVENASFNKVVMKGTPNDVKALASIYWNSSSKEVYLSIQHLRQISQGKQFQLWAIVDGKPVSAGVFDRNFSGLLRMKNITGAAAFAVTIEQRGGVASPTMSTMQVLGTVSAVKS